VHDRIVCVSLESDLAVMSRDPLIKGVMQKQVGQQRGDDAPYTKDNFEFRRVISFQRSPHKRLRQQGKLA
jgi:hypothetical protein